MKTMIHKYLKITVTAGVFFALFLMSACDSSNALLETESAAAQNVAPSVANLSQKLQLTEDQTQKLGEVVAKRGDREPGTLWYMAAEMQSTLSEDQKAALLEDVQPLARRPGPAARGPMNGPANRPANGRMRGAPPEDRDGPPFIDNLTDEQKEQLSDLRESHREAMKALMDQRRDGTMSDEEFQTSMQNLRDGMQESLKSVLTEEQLKAFDAAREAREERMQDRGEDGRGRFNNRRAGGRGNDARNAGNREEWRERAADLREEMTAAKREALGLTSEQESQIEALRTAEREKAQAIMEGLRDSGEDRESIREAAREKMEALREENKTAMAEILTEEQLEIMEIHQALAYNVAKNRSGDAKGGRRGSRR